MVLPFRPLTVCYMNLKHLRYFVAVAEHQSISQAAVYLAIAQSALSRQISQLEQDLGVRLLHRHGRGVSLTMAGESFLQHSREILRHMQQAQQDLEALKTTPRDTVVIGFPPTVAQVLSVPLAIKFQQRFPQARLRIEEAYSGSVLEWLATGKVDVAVLYEGPHSKTIPGDKLINEQLYLIGPANSELKNMSEVRAGRLSELPLVLPNHPHGLRLAIEQKSRQSHFQLQVVMEISGLEITKSLVKTSNMYTVLPYAAVHREVSSGELTAAKIVKPVISRSLLLTSSTRKPLSQTTREAIKLVRELVADLDRKGHWLHEPSSVKKIRDQ